MTAIIAALEKAASNIPPTCLRRNGLVTESGGVIVRDGRVVSVSDIEELTNA